MAQLCHDSTEARVHYVNVGGTARACAEAANDRSLARRPVHVTQKDRSGDQMTRIDEKAPDDALQVGDLVRLREAYISSDAGTRGRIIGFYLTEPCEALLALEHGEELRVPHPKLERVLLERPPHRADANI